MNQNKKETKVTFRLSWDLKSDLEIAATKSQIKQAIIMRNGIRKEVDKILQLAKKELP